jgi:transposase
VPNRVRVLMVPDADRAELERRARSKGVPARAAERARIVLLAAAGLTGAEIAGQTGCTEPTVIKWRRQYTRSGLAGLEDAPRGGGPVTVLTEQAVCEILAATVTPPPESLQKQGITHWSSRRLADWLGRSRKIPVSHDSITRVWRRFCLQPRRSEGFKFSTDPELDARVCDIVGLYLNPPENAATGQVTDACYPRHRHQEFLKFLKKSAAAYPGVALHVVLDNYATRKHQDIGSLLARPENQQITLHFTSASCSWLNLVECFFSGITRQAIRRGSFTSVRQLTAAIGAFTDSWNDHPRPLAWTKDADEVLASIQRAKTKTKALTDH